MKEKNLDFKREAVETPETGNSKQLLFSLACHRAYIDELSV
jgi:hypothetical protein